MKVRAKSLVHDRVADESEHRRLSVGTVYDVVGLDSENFRVIDDSDQPFLYSKALFEIVDPSIPGDWITETRDDVYYTDPPECAARGFYEDYFDGVASAVGAFEDFRKRSALPHKSKVQTAR
jgi:hypothetical protein